MNSKPPASKPPISKPTVFLLPGLICDDFVWEKQIAALSDLANLQVVTYPDCTSMTQMAERVLAKAPARFAVAGHSMGGRVAMQVMIELEKRDEIDRVTGICLLDTAAGGPGAHEREKRLPLVAKAKAQGMEALVREWLPPMVHPARLSDLALMAPLQDMVRRATPQQFANHVQALLERPDALSLLPRITCPSMVLCGKEDAWRTPKEHEKMAGLIPGTSFTIVPHCGHMATVEQPANINQAMRAWLAEIITK